MLVIHGAADENDGTFPMQSERYFAALKAFGELKYLLALSTRSIIPCLIEPFHATPIQG
jgi:hypothetical protein